MLEWERRYAEHSHTSVERLHLWGRFVEVCDGSCSWPGCEGYKMGHQWEDALFEDWERGSRG